MAAHSHPAEGARVAAPVLPDRPWPADRQWSTTTAPDGTEIRWTRDDPDATAPTGSPHPQPLVLCNGIACSDAYWRGVVPRLVAARPVIRWDYRGHGRSGAPVDRSALGVTTSTEDLRAVLDAAGAARVVLVGHSYGVQIVLEACRQFPDRVAAVVAVAGSPGQPLARGDLGSGRRDADAAERFLGGLHRLTATAPQAAARAWHAVWDSPAIPRLARLLGATTVDAPAEVMQDYFAHVRDRDPELLLEMMRRMQAHRADDVLEDLAVPLLALAGDRDRVTPLVVMRRVALDAPDGELAVRHGGSHTLPAEHPGWVAGEILRFLTARGVA